MPLTPSAWPNDRRRIGRSTNERRDRRTRLEGLWTEAERTRFIRILREERQEAKAITIQSYVCQRRRWNALLLGKVHHRSCKRAVLRFEAEEPESALAGQRHLCAHTIGIGVNRNGAFAEYITMPMTNIWHHHDGIDLDVASIFDPFGNAVHTARSTEVLGEDILITGAGPIGCMAAAVVRHAGGRFVVVSEPNAYRRALAERMGATLVIDPTERDLHDVQKELGMVEGFDVGLEMSGNAAALHAMVDTMAHGGRIAMLGIPETEIAIDWHEVVFNMLTIRGIYGREMYETWYQMTVMLQSGLDVRPVITHRFPWDEFERAFAVAGSGESGKVLLEWDTSLG